MMRTPPLAVALPLALWAVSCGGTQALSKAGPARPVGGKQEADKRVGFVTPARLFALPGDTKSESSSADGQRRSVAHGMRLVEHPDGRLERGTELLPSPARHLELPERLGGGVAFYVKSSGKTLVWRAKSWTAKLEPLANVDFDVREIVAGFDRLYLVEQRSRELVALDPNSGKAVGLGALPSAPQFGSMAFADAWFGAVDEPFRGVLVSFDAGASWRPLGMVKTVRGVTLENGEIVVRSSLGRFAISPNGVLRQKSHVQSAEAVFEGIGRSQLTPQGDETDDAEESASERGKLGRWPLATAALHGWPDSPKTAIVAYRGALGRVALSDGEVLDVAEDAFPAGGECYGVALGDGFGFVCGRERGPTDIFAFEPPLGLRPVLSFAEPRFVAASGNGALVIRGGCRKPSADTYCIRSRAGALRSVRVRGDRGVERVAALLDGRVAVLVPPRFGAPGLLTLVDEDGKATTTELSLPKKLSPSTRALLEKGLWLDSLVQRKDGKLATWVAAADPFVGVRIGLDGKVEVGRSENGLERAMFSGELALVLGRSGLAAESVDGGFKWREVELPPDFDADDVRQRVGDQIGCSRVGCAFGSWMRIGWRGKRDDDRDALVSVEPPPETMLPSPEGGRWLVTCAPTGQRSGPATKVSRSRARRLPSLRRPRRSPLPVPDELESSDWLGFLGLAPPAKPKTSIGFDYGTEYSTVQLRGYVWGPRGADWSRVGTWLVRVADRFSVDGVWSTTATKSPWADDISAAQAFGKDVTGPPAAWNAELEPSGTAGALLIGSRGSTELFLMEDGRSIVPVRTHAATIPTASGVVKLGSTWYLGSPVGRTLFRVYRVEGDRLELAWEYRLDGPNELGIQLVRNARGDALGLWAQATKVRGVATRWFVYALDERTGEVGAPLEIEPKHLSETPRACADEDDGWVLEGALPVQPYVDFVQGSGSVRARNVEARLLAGVDGMCLEALAAQADNAPERVPGDAGRTVSSWVGGRDALALTLTDRRPGGRRWGFVCTR